MVLASEKDDGTLDGPFGGGAGLKIRIHAQSEWIETNIVNIDAVCVDVD